MLLRFLQYAQGPQGTASSSVSRLRADDRRLQKLLRNAHVAFRGVVTVDLLPDLGWPSGRARIERGG